MWDHLFGALAAYKRIINIAGCANIVSKTLSGKTSDYKYFKYT